MSEPKAGRAYYYALQSEARERVQKALNARILRHNGSLANFDRLTLCSIASPQMPDALAFADTEWPKFYGKETFEGFGKRWHDIVLPMYHAIDIFDLAIWQEVDGEKVLAAMAVGEPSHARTHLTVKWVERFYGKTYIGGRVLMIILACAEEYAKLIGCERVLIKQPLAPHKYARYGYEVYKHPGVAYGGNYMAKEL